MARRPGRGADRVAIPLPGRREHVDPERHQSEGVDTGFAAARVTALKIEVLPHETSLDRGRRLLRSVIAAGEGVPGVARVRSRNRIPCPADRPIRLHVEHATASRTWLTNVDTRTVSQIFRDDGHRARRWPGFTEHDDADAPLWQSWMSDWPAPMWPGETAIGRAFASRRGAGGGWIHVIGIVGTCAPLG